MRRIKLFESFVNDNKAIISVLAKNIQVAYDKEPKDVMYTGEDEKFFNFYVIDADMDNAYVAAKTLEDPAIFGERVLFEIVDLTVQSYAELKKIGVKIPENTEHVIHVMIAKKNPGPYKN